MSETNETDTTPTAIDPVCAIHLKRRSEHVCLYCCICFKSLTIEECHIAKDGTREDVCNACAEEESKQMNSTKTEIDPNDNDAAFIKKGLQRASALWAEVLAADQPFAKLSDESKRRAAQELAGDQFHIAKRLKLLRQGEQHLKERLEEVRGLISTLRGIDEDFEDIRKKYLALT